MFHDVPWCFLWGVAIRWLCSAKLHGIHCPVRRTLGIELQGRQEKTWRVMYHSVEPDTTHLRNLWWYVQNISITSCYCVQVPLFIDTVWFGATTASIWRFWGEYATESDDVINGNKPERLCGWWWQKYCKSKKYPKINKNQHQGSIVCPHPNSRFHRLLRVRDVLLQPGDKRKLRKHMRIKYDKIVRPHEHIRANTQRWTSFKFRSWPSRIGMRRHAQAYTVKRIEGICVCHISSIIMHYLANRWRHTTKIPSGWASPFVIGNETICSWLLCPCLCTVFANNTSTTQYLSKLKLTLSVQGTTLLNVQYCTGKPIQRTMIPHYQTAPIHTTMWHPAH